MALVNMASGNQQAIPAKTFFAFCATIAFSSFTLTNLLEKELQFIFLWSGIFLLILTIISIFEWILKAQINSFDRKLPEESITYWETMAQPQWERFLNEIIRDLYLIAAFILVIWKAQNDHKQL